MLRKIFVQTSAGSFNHHAIELLKECDVLLKPNIEFAGPQSDAMQKAVEENGLVFTALCNDIIENNLIPSTIEALQDFEITELLEGIRMKIEMCLIRSKNAVTNNVPLSNLASHPAALKQITNWHDVQEKKLGYAIGSIEEIGGTSEAARKLSVGEFNDNTGVIAPERSADIYPGLYVVEKGIQNRDDNYTHFGLMEVKKRVVKVSIEEARAHLQEIVDQLKSRIAITSDFYQTTKAA